MTVLTIAVKDATGSTQTVSTMDALLAQGIPGKVGTYTTETNGTIAIGGTAQNVLAANASRSKLKFQNISTGDMWVKTTGAAGNGVGMWIPAGSFYEWPSNDIPSGAISVWGATTSQSYFVAEG